MKLISLILSLMISATFFAQDDANKAVKSYQNEHFEDALFHFQETLKKDSTDINTWYNIGLCYQAMHKLGPAIHSFERVLQLQPDYHLAKEQIDRTIVITNSSITWEPRLNLFISKIYALPIYLWVISSLLFSIILGVSLVYLFNTHSKKIKFIAKLFLLVSSLFLVLSVLLSAGQNAYYTEGKYGVILKEKPMIYNETGEKINIDLKEGTRITIDHFEDDFVYFEHENHHVFKVNRSDIGVL